MSTFDAKISNQNLVAYLAAPLPTYHSFDYELVHTVLKQHYTTTLDAAHLFTSNDNWLTTYKQQLAPVDIVYYLPMLTEYTDDFYTVGLGVVTEYNYLKDKAAHHFLCLPIGLQHESIAVYELKGFRPIEQEHRTRQAYAYPVYDALIHHSLQELLKG